MQEIFASQKCVQVMRVSIAKSAEKSVLDNNVIVFGGTDMKINFLGDSITYGAGASKPEQNYVNQLGAMLHAEVRN